ncbi:MAG: hypothetical protein Q8936_16555 [Bacillota bacterium]|nr:hypothetical protein [Bacillota bacterium]
MNKKYPKIVNTITSSIKSVSEALKFNSNKHAIIQEMYDLIIENKHKEIHSLSTELEQLKKLNYQNEKQLNNITNENTSIRNKVAFLEDLLTRYKSS